MPPITRVGDPRVEQKGNELFAVSKLSEEVDRVWAGYFKDRAIYSTFQDVRLAVFEGDQVRIRLSREEDLKGLTQTVDGVCIQGANVDWASRQPTDDPGR